MPVDSTQRDQATNQQNLHPDGPRRSDPLQDGFGDSNVFEGAGAKYVPGVTDTSSDSEGQ